MIRHYLPSIAALFVLIFVVTFTAFSPAPQSSTRLQSTVLAQGARCVEPPDGLINWWDADKSVGTTAKDIKGGADGQITSATIIDGKVGKAFSFPGNDFNAFGRLDSTGGYILLPKNFFSYPTTQVGNDPFTFEFWFQVGSGGDGVIFGQQSARPWEGHFSWIPAVFVGTDGVLGVEMFWDGRPPIYSNRGVRDGQWHHLAVVYDGANETAYLDGSNIGSTQKDQHPHANGQYNYTIGTGASAGRQGSVGGWHSFKGAVDEFTIYNKTLATDEIQAIFNAGNLGKCKLECGNNLIQDAIGEICDGTDLGGKSCATEKGAGFTGSLLCASDCKSYDTTQCVPPPPIPLCSDGKDNDNDKLIDFPSDKGCESADDGDETDPPPPPINRNITLKRSPVPTVIIQPILKEREVLTFDTACTTCTITTTPDPSQFIGGSQQANAGFIIVAALINSADSTVSYTIVGSGDIIQETKLFNATGQEYTGIGESADTQYPGSFLADQDNSYNIKVRSGTQLEEIRMQSLLLPSTDVTPANGSQHYYLLLGEDSNGKKHLAVSKGRHWDLATLADANMTPEPFYSFFLNRGDFASCVQGLQNYPKAATLLSTPLNFQTFLDLLTLCQR